MFDKIRKNAHLTNELRKLNQSQVIPILLKKITKEQPPLCNEITKQFLDHICSCNQCVIELTKCMYMIFDEVPFIEEIASSKIDTVNLYATLKQLQQKIQTERETKNDSSV